MNSLLILGNGFDLDLGWKTSYQDYINSDCFTQLLDSGNSISIFLEQYLLSRIPVNPFANNLPTELFSTENWYDLEEALKHFIDIYSNPENIKSQPEDFYSKTYEDYKKILSSLSTYIFQQQDSELNRNSAAALLLKSTLTSHCFSIISFNYTSLDKIAKFLDADIADTPIANIHGTAQNHSIIFGVDENIQTANSFNFFIKQFSPYYQAIHIRDTLDNVREIIFFGLSLGEIDYNYFSDFFDKQSSIDRSHIAHKKITFITKDEYSRLAILSQIKKMTKNKTNYLLDNNDVSFIRTSIPSDFTILKNYCEEISSYNNMNRSVNFNSL